MYKYKFVKVKKIKLSSHEIIKSKGFLPAFINKNNTLNKRFKSSVFEKIF